MGILHRFLDLLVVSMRMTDDKVSGDGVAARPGSDQVVYRPSQFRRINFAAGPLLPIVGARFEAEKESLETRLNHQCRQFGRNEPSIEGVRRMKLNSEASLHHSSKKRPQDLSGSVK